MRKKIVLYPTPPISSKAFKLNFAAYAVGTEDFQ